MCDANESPVPRRAGEVGRAVGYASCAGNELKWAVYDVCDPIIANSCAPRGKGRARRTWARPKPGENGSAGESGGAAIRGRAFAKGRAPGARGRPTRPATLPRLSRF